jgi:ankyrin repeat protein
MKSPNLSWDSAVPPMMTRGYSLFFALGTLFLSGHLLCVAQSRSLDKELFQAVAKGDIGAVRVLLANGADLDAKDDRGDTPLIIAVGNHNVAAVKLLIEKGADISARNHYEETALFEAARSMDPDLLRVLLDTNPDIKDKNAALFEAAESAPVVLQMAGAPATPNVHNEPTPAVVTEAPWVKSVRMLLDSGANVEARDEEGDSPLIRAASFGQTETFELLLERGAKINVRDKRGMTPLIAAACACAVATMNSTYDIMKILLERGADVNARTRDGTTALMMAAGSPDGPASVKLLLNKGADPMAKNNRGRTAMTFVEDSPFPEKVRLLKRAMAKAQGASSGVLP